MIRIQRAKAAFWLYLLEFGKVLTKKNLETKKCSVITIICHAWLFIVLKLMRVYFKTSWFWQIPTVSGSQNLPVSK